MQTNFFILAALMLFAFAGTRRADKNKSTWFQQLKGWQKILGVLAAILTVVILLNPEFLALGLLGDAAFLDMFVFALTLQLHLHLVRAGRGFVSVLTRSMRWAGIPSPGLCYLVAFLTVTIGNAVSACQKTLERIVS